MSELSAKPPKHWYHSAWLAEGVGIPAAVAASVPAVKVFVDTFLYPAEPQGRTAYIVAVSGIVGVLFILVSSLLKTISSRRKDLVEVEKERHDGLVAGIKIVHSILLRTPSGILPEDTVRVTLHHVQYDDHGNFLSYRQILNYQGEAKGSGREFDRGRGVVSQAIRSKKIVYYVRRRKYSQEEHVSEMVAKFGYLMDDARKSRNVMGWLAIPLESADRAVYCVLYLDSMDARALAKNRLGGIAAASTALRAYIQERYKL